MRSVCLKAAMLSAALSLSAGCPANAEEERDSYLPPKELVAKATPAPVKKVDGAAVATIERRARTTARQQKRYLNRPQKRVVRVGKGGYAKRYVVYDFPMQSFGAY
ncbi:MAG: hypothetical protein QM659_10635 [Rhodomicrobium sp.]